MATLQNAYVGSCNLSRVTLNAANLRKAQLVFTNLESADLVNVNLQGVDLFNSNQKNVLRLSSIAYELIQGFDGRGEFFAAIHQQINYYNHHRIHTALKMPPAVFAAQSFSDTCLHKRGT